MPGKSVLLVVRSLYSSPKGLEYPHDVVAGFHSALNQAEAGTAVARPFRLWVSVLFFNVMLVKQVNPSYSEMDGGMQGPSWKLVSIPVCPT